MKYVVFVLVFVLILLQQDFWLKGNRSLCWGFLPVELLYQGCVSVLASLVWLFAVLFAWPQDAAQEDDA